MYYIKNSDYNLNKDNIFKEYKKTQQKETEIKRPFLDNGQNYSKNREIDLMRKSYSDLNKTLYPFVLETLNEYEFIGSPIYNPIGIDRETLAQMVDRSINLAEVSLDEIAEIKDERAKNMTGQIDRWVILRSNMESLILNDIFAIRRPNYFKMYAPNIF